VRHWSVFHFDPEEFGRVAVKSPWHECVFARGDSSGEYFEFADALTMDMFVGLVGGSDPQYFLHAGLVIPAVKDLTLRFIEAAVDLIGKEVIRWGFTLRDSY
jgi:hypothetical protein